MSDEIVRYEITPADKRKDKLLKRGAVALPVLGAVLPSVGFFLAFLFSVTPAVAAMFLFLTFIGMGVGLLGGGIGSAIAMVYRRRWLSDVRERVAVDGIRASEVDWFWGELKSEEKKTLNKLERRDEVLADAYRETLASRLTATRIIKSSTQELLLAKRRRNRLKNLKSKKVGEFLEQIEKDIENLANIKTEAREMLIEAESRLQMIEAAASRGNQLAGKEIALKKLSARSENLPLALEAMKEEEIRRELEVEIRKELEAGPVD